MWRLLSEASKGKNTSYTLGTSKILFTCQRNIWYFCEWNLYTKANKPHDNQNINWKISDCLENITAPILPMLLCPMKIVAYVRELLLRTRKGSPRSLVLKTHQRERDTGTVILQEVFYLMTNWSFRMSHSNSIRLVKYYLKSKKATGTCVDYFTLTPYLYGSCTEQQKKTFTFYLLT